jgi:hypothetical protein
LSQLERSNGTTWDVLTTGGGGGTWGSITGTLSNQTDLKNVLDAKAALAGNTFTGVQQFPDGTVSAPSITFSSAPGTGIFRISSNSFGFTCGGARAAYITADAFYKRGYETQQIFVVQRANGTESAPTKILSGDYIGGLAAGSYYDDGSGGAGWANGTGIRFYATEDRNGSGNLGQRTAFLSIANGSSTASTRGILTESGAWLFGFPSITSTEITLASLGTFPRVQINGTSTSGQSAQLISRFDATAGDAPQLILAKSRGTAIGTDYTAVAVNDTLGIWAGEGADGTEFIRAGSIRCIVDGTVSTGVVPGRWEFYTNNASGVATKALTIDSSQNITPVGDLLLATGKTVKINGTKIGLEDLNTPTDTTTNNASTSYHGLLPKLSGDATQFLNGNGAWQSGGLVASQVILKQTLGAATTAWTVSLPVACKAVRITCYIINASGSGNGITFGVNGTSTGHAQNTGSDNGTSIYGSESSSPYLGTCGANNSVDITGTFTVGGSYTHANLNTAFQFATDNLTQGSKAFRIDNTADISSIVITGAQTNGIGVGSYIIIERVDADVAPVFGVVFSGTADKTVANTASATSLIPTGTGSATLAANSYSVAKKLKVSLAGKYSTKASSPGNLTVLIKLGSTTIVTTGAHALDASEANQFWRMECVIDCRTTGASGTVIGQSGWEHAAAASAGVLQFAPAVATAAITLDTTASQAVDVTAQFSVADAGNTITTTNCAIEWLN